MIPESDDITLHGPKGSKGSLHIKRSRACARAYVSYSVQPSMPSQRQNGEDCWCCGAHSVSASSSSEVHWNRDMVAASLRDAAATLRSMPAVKVQGHFNMWPSVLQTHWEAYGTSDEKQRRRPATPEAIDDMDMVLSWLGWLTRHESELVWWRADGLGWKAICVRLGVGRTTAWHRWTTALEKIAARLNAGS